ncbi:hypothetical protein AMTRI_Chr12g269500 [Amborella trichopoda]
MRETWRDLSFRIDGPFSNVPKVLLGGLNELDRKARQILVRSFCPLLDDTFGLNDWAKRGWGLSYLLEVFSLGKGRAAFGLRSDHDVARAWKERFYRVQGSLTTLLEWSPSMHSSFVKRDLTWVHLWGVPLHVWNELVFKEIVNSFGEYCAVDLKLLGGPMSFVRVQISRFLGVPCPRHIRLRVGHDLFLIDVCLQSNYTMTDNFHKSDQMAQPCET